jgi:hypothetical protein
MRYTKWHREKQRLILVCVMGSSSNRCSMCSRKPQRVSTVVSKVQELYIRQAPYTHPFGHILHSLALLPPSLYLSHTRAGARACVRTWARTHMGPQGVRVCVHACMRTCLRVRVCTRVFTRRVGSLRACMRGACGRVRVCSDTATRGGHSVLGVDRTIRSVHPFLLIFHGPVQKHFTFF